MPSLLSVALLGSLPALAAEVSVVEKGHASNPAWSANGDYLAFEVNDYGGNVSHRAGGMKDLEKLTESGRQWNTDFGIHVNLVESYPEANHFGDNILVKPYQKAWDWMEQSYRMDYAKDLGSGQL